MTHLFAGDIHRKRIANWPERYPWLPPEAFVYFTRRTQTLPAEIEDTVSLLSRHYGQSEEAVARAANILKFKQDVLWCMMDALWGHFSMGARIPTGPVLPGPTAARESRSGAEEAAMEPVRPDNDAARHGRAAAHAVFSAVTADGRRPLVNCSPDLAPRNELTRLHPDVCRRRASDGRPDGPRRRTAPRGAAPLHAHCTPSVLRVLEEETGLLRILRVHHVHVHDALARPASATSPSPCT